MRTISKTRQTIIQSSLAMPLFVNFVFVQADELMRFTIPENIYSSLYPLYGSLIDDIVSNDKIQLMVPPIAENGLQVQVHELHREAVARAINPGADFLERLEIEEDIADGGFGL